MQLLSDIAPYLALAAACVAVALCIAVFVLWRGLRHLRRGQLIVLGGHEERDIIAHVASLDSQVRNLREAVELLTDQLDEHKGHLDRALTNRAILRYDAFRDTGGEQSASFALLDDYRSGVVLSVIAARDFARIYVKNLRHGVADRELSPEEQRAVEEAVPHPLGTGQRGPRSARAPLGPPAAEPHAPDRESGQARPATDETPPPQPTDDAAPATAAKPADNAEPSPPPRHEPHRVDLLEGDDLWPDGRS